MRTFRKVLSKVTEALAITTIICTAWMTMIVTMDNLTGSFALFSTYGTTAVVTSLIAGIVTGLSLLWVSDSSYVRE